MDQKAQPTPNRVYKDLQPYFEWYEDEVSATLIIMLPGFTKEQLRVQVTSKGVLRINCERLGIENIWHRFGKEFPIPPFCDTNEVNAKFERGVLSIKFPKLITPAYNKPQEQETITNPPQEDSMPQQHSDEPKAPLPTQAQVVDNQQESPKKEIKEEQISDEKEKNKIEESPKKDIKEPSDEKENNKIEEVKTLEAQRKQKDKMVQRLKTRVLDFNITLRSKDDKDVDQLGFGCGDTKPKKGKILMNLIVAILLVLVIGVYVKNAFWASSKSSQGEAKEF